MNQEELKTWLDYNPETGIFIWKKTKSNKKKGSIAGCTSHGYIQISFNSRIYLAHRLAWFYVYGYWPKEIDHINRDKADNRIKNLRECTHPENGSNTGMYSHNTSGIKGVSWNKTVEKWEAYITRNGKRFPLGLFTNKKKAAKARKEAEKACY